MSKFMVAGFVQMETIIKVEALPVPYKQFESIPDLVNSGIGGAGVNEAQVAWQRGGLYEHGGKKYVKAPD